MRLLFNKGAERCMQDDIQMVSWELFEGLLRIEAPVGFQDMDEQRCEDCYPYENRPQIIKEIQNENVQLTLQLMNKELREEDVRNVAEQICELTEKVFPRYDYSPVCFYDNGYMTIGWFLMEMKNFEMEHMKAVFGIREQMILMTLTYPKAEYMKWRVLSKYMFESIDEVQNATAGKRRF